MGAYQIPANYAFGCLSAYGLYPLYEKSVSRPLPEEIYCCSERQSGHGRSDVELLKDSVSLTSGNPVLSSLRLSTDKAVYGNRSKVTLKLPELPG